jgi:hypothetical protein
MVSFSGQQLPDATAGRHGWILRADAKLVQIRWAIEAITSPELTSMPPAKARLLMYRRALTLIDAEFGPINKKERESTARKLQEIALSLWRARHSASRAPISSADRLALIASFEKGQPYCWICGVRFNYSAMEAFIGGKRFLSTSQLFVDFAYPRGRNKSDLTVTVDHVLPVAAGGTNDLDNLRLCCSWCNTAKSDALDVYRSAQYRGSYEHPTLGMFMLPSYSWVSRLLALVGACSDCGRNQADGPLVIAASSAVRQLNPAFLRIYCLDHDPWADERIVPAKGLP